MNKPARYNEIDYLIAGLLKEKQTGGSIGLLGVGKGGLPPFQGNGLLSTASAIAKKIVSFTPFARRIHLMAQGPRKKATKRLEDFLDKTAEHKVVDIKLGRKPIIDPVKWALDLLSQGKFSKKQHQLGYDQIWHQYLLVKLDNGKTYKLEKNEVIVEKEAKPDDYRNKLWDIQVPEDKQISLKDMFANASKDDTQKFYQYDGSSANCQRFSRLILEKNGLIPDEEKAKEFENQDTEALMDTLHPVGRKIADGAVDLYASIDRLRGDGIKMKQRNKTITL